MKQGCDRGAKTPLFLEADLESRCNEDVALLEGGQLLYPCAFWHCIIRHAFIDAFASWELQGIVAWKLLDAYSTWKLLRRMAGALSRLHLHIITSHVIHIHNYWDHIIPMVR